MAWYEDLTPCDDFGTHLAGSLLAVGWLQRDRPYAAGVIDATVYDKLVDLARNPWQPVISAGLHSCDLCLYEAEAACSTNLFIPGDGTLFVCPTLITHSMNAHRYAPPLSFREAVLACPPMRSLAYFRAVLASGGRQLVRSFT